MQNDFIDSALGTKESVAIVPYIKDAIESFDGKVLLPIATKVTITYFVPDKKKAGGAYVDITGIIKEIDEYEWCIVMTDKKKIPIEQVRAIEGELFKCLEL